MSKGLLGSTLSIGRLAGQHFKHRKVAGSILSIGRLVGQHLKHRKAQCPAAHRKIGPNEAMNQRNCSTKYTVIGSITEQKEETSQPCCANPIVIFTELEPYVG